MIKAVFFDWFNTLARYESPREELQSQALQEFGIHVSPQEIMHGLLAADRILFEENAVSPVRERSHEERAKVYIRYQETILSEAGVNISGEPDTLVKIITRAQELSQGMSFTLFDDVLSTLKTLKKRSLPLGLLTNFDGEMKPICQQLGLEPYIDFVVTSAEVGADKPSPPIFLAALEQTGINAAEKVHVGDQYKSDVIGAGGVGINLLLIDRNA